MKMLVIICLLMSMWVMPRVAEERAQVLCGRQLAEARELYCWSMEAQQQKRAGADMPGHKGPGKGGVVGSAWWAIPPSQALQLTSRGKRYQGLVDECCYKACTTSEIVNYC